MKIELWQIGTSLPAPKFEIISRPNDWVKTVKSSTGSSEFTDTKIKQLEFWNLFKDFAKQNNTTLRFQKSYPQHWTIISIGNSDCHISLTINSRENLYGCEIYIPNNKDLYQKFFEQKQEIEAELDMGLEWMELSEKKASRIKTSIIGDFEDESSWEDIFEWMKITGEKFKRVFPRYIK